jgi:hypothetical protein
MQPRPCVVRGPWVSAWARFSPTHVLVVAAYAHVEISERRKASRREDRQDTRTVLFAMELCGGSHVSNVLPLGDTSCVTGVKGGVWTSKISRRSARSFPGVQISRLAELSPDVEMRTRGQHF